MLAERLATLKDAARTFMLKALVLSFGRVGYGTQCAHDDVNGYTVVRGDLIHCKCGASFKVKCMHTKVRKLLPKVWQCVDCLANRGAGEIEGRYA